MRHVATMVLGLVTTVAAGAAAEGVPPRFEVSATELDAYDFVEVAARVAPSAAGNPFLDTTLTGELGPADGPRLAVTGFCDSADGSVFRLRFMPRHPGPHAYTVTLRRGAQAWTHTGTLQVRRGARRGPVRVDREFPWHFAWAGTGERYFWNGSTTYLLAGWDDETIAAAIDRLARLRVNRIRVALAMRVENGRAWFENVFPTPRFSMRLAPWVAARPESLESPGYDVTRFDVDYWRRFERLVDRARARDMIVSVVFYVDGARAGTEPFGREGAGGADEKRYYAYAVARLAAFSNVMWDVANEYRFFRDEAWAQAMGSFLDSIDPYDHLTSIHGFEDFRFRTAPWADFAMYQSWDECGGNAFMVAARQVQAATGRPMPQVNEEYGYEDHYPPWGCGVRQPPGRSADTRRRLAWEISMAGGYQTTGERADRGTGWGPDSGGGWVNGRGDDSMTMLEGYRHLVDFFTGFEWWRLEPANALVSHAQLCLAEPGRRYVVYLRWPVPPTTLHVEPGEYRARWFDPRTGAWTPIGSVRAGEEWTMPARPAPADADWVLLLEREGEGRRHVSAQGDDGGPGTRGPRPLEPPRVRIAP